MEVRAHYALIGSFVLLCLFGGIFFSLWMAKVDKGTPMAEYDILLEEKVSGLAESSEVLFNGIRVGTVTKLRLSQDHPGAVLARISIGADTPVRNDSEATLENKGLTGILLISIAGGSSSAPLNLPPPGKVGEIKYRPSPLAAVMANMSTTMDGVNQLLFRVATLLSPENMQPIGQIMRNIATVSDSLAKRAGNFEGTVTNLEQTIAEMRKITVNLNKLLEKDAHNSLAAIEQATKRLDSTLAAMEPGLKQFSKEGLTEVKLFFVEARNLTQTLTRIGNKLESDPRRYFLGAPLQEYKAP